MERMGRAGGSLGEDVRWVLRLFGSRGFAWTLLGLLSLAVLVEGGGRILLRRASTRYFHPYIGELYWPGATRSRTTPDGRTFQWRINRHGFRGPDLTEVKPVGERRVFLFGGSTAACVHAPEEEAWPSRVAGLLRESCPGSDWVVENCARDGMSSFQGFNLFLHVVAPRFEPDIVCVQFGFNDVMASRSSGYPLPYGDIGKGEPLLDTRPASLFLLEQMRLYFRIRTHGVVGAGDLQVPQGFTPQGVSEARRSYTDRLGTWVGEARRRGIAMVLLTEPYALPGPGGDASLGACLAEMLDATREAGRELDVPVIDVHAALAGDPDLFLEGLHLREEGMRRAAAIVGEGLRVVAEGASGR